MIKWLEKYKEVFYLLLAVGVITALLLPALPISAGDVEDLAVTATGITSGIRRVVVTADGDDFTISVYDAGDVLIDDATTPLGANSVPDSGNSYVLMQNNCMAYAEYIKLSVSE